MNVDYEDLARKAKKIREQANQINLELSKAYESIGGMHSVWYGQLYNDLCVAFNNITGSLNQLLSLVVSDIPYALEIAANNYSSADRNGQKVTSAVHTEPKKIINVPIIKDIGMDYTESKVEPIRQKVITNLKSVKDRMNDIQVTYNTINWRSDASEAFATKLKKFKNEIDEYIQQIEGDFQKFMSQAAQTISTADKKSTV